jgi:hypothetical protein
MKEGHLSSHLAREGTVAAASALRAFWLKWFSKPAGDRPLFKSVCKRRLRKLLLLGLSDGQRATRLISLAQRFHAADQVEFVGIDRFDSRPVDVPHFTLKQAHQLLRTTSARIKLIPGDPREALVRAANSLQGIELVVISADQAADSLSQAWFYLPRTLATEALILREEIAAEGPILKLISRIELQRLAAAASIRRRAA